MCRISNLDQKLFAEELSIIFINTFLETAIFFAVNESRGFDSLSAAASITPQI